MEHTTLQKSSDSGTVRKISANAVVGKGQPPPDPSPIPEAPSNGTLFPSQSKARGRALIASVTYIWGPPGCGKTYVLSDVVRSNFEAGKRVFWLVS